MIMGIDWMSRHGAVIDCAVKTVSLPGATEQDDRVVIAATSGNPLMEKFLAYLDDKDSVDTHLSEIELIAGTPIVSEFPQVFQDIPGLPPFRCIDFEIKLQPDTTPISRVPYRMAPVEMKELKAQLDDLLSHGLIR